MNHYKRIDKLQKKKLKEHMREQEGADADDEDKKKELETKKRADPFAERNRNIELAKKKKVIED